LELNRDLALGLLDLARWAPSGDNTQPWRFELKDAGRLAIHGHDTRDSILYDFDGHASHMAHGALIETLRIAASDRGLSMRWSATSDPEQRLPIYQVDLEVDPRVKPDPLSECITSRAVQRRPMRMTPLADEQRAALISAAGDDFDVQLFESFRQRLTVAKLLWANAHIRLTCPEAFEVHRHIVEWHARFSKDRIPEQAVGVDPLTARLMEWVMQRWERVEFFNRYLLGTVAPRIQLDVLPALFCAGHLLIRPKRPLSSLEDWVRLGAAMQRVWLTATRVGLHLQPQMTPVIFRWYARANRRFSKLPGSFEQALALAAAFEDMADASTKDEFGFFCRVGTCSPPSSRSTRLDLQDLLVR
jgi:nitroreductase